ncbi:MAG: hypothetical protein LBQ02_01855 [Candidatus Nomurabacteria bacterium]|jgi:hypothetical protein|nr:hypothetical protein [Candidatus Nomurabacteria bacterium]
MKPNEQSTPTNSSAPVAPADQAQTVADLAQSPAATPEPAASGNPAPAEAPVATRPPAVQPSADGSIIAPIGNELFHEPSLVKPKNNTPIIILVVVGGVILIGATILIFWLLTKD